MLRLCSALLWVAARDQVVWSIVVSGLLLLLLANWRNLEILQLRPNVARKSGSPDKNLSPLPLANAGQCCTGHHWPALRSLRSNWPLQTNTKSNAPKRGSFSTFTIGQIFALSPFFLCLLSPRKLFSLSSLLVFPFALHWPLGSPPLPLEIARS